MTIEQLIESGSCKVLNAGEDIKREITGIYCCDLLSIAMSRAKADSAWVTVMANMNTLAVASLTDVACVVLAEGVAFDDACIQKAVKEGIAVLASDRPVFETALHIYEELSA